MCSFNSIASELVASESVEHLKTLVQKLLSEDILVQVAKPALLHLATAIKALQEEQFYDVAVFMVTSIKHHPSSSSLDEADFLLRDGLFTYCVGCEE